MPLLLCTSGRLFIRKIWHYAWLGVYLLTNLVCMCKIPFFFFWIFFLVLISCFQLIYVWYCGGSNSSLHQTVNCMSYYKHHKTVRFYCLLRWGMIPTAILKHPYRITCFHWFLFTQNVRKITAQQCLPIKGNDHCATCEPMGHIFGTFGHSLILILKCLSK